MHDRGRACGRRQGVRSGAGEGKALATAGTAKETEEIATQINTIAQHQPKHVTRCGEVSASIGEVSEVATAIAARGRKQAAATQGNRCQREGLSQSPLSNSFL